MRWWGYILNLLIFGLVFVVLVTIESAFLQRISEISFFSLLIIYELAHAARRRWPVGPCCASCGYDLRALTAPRCPECGDAI